MTGVKEVLEIIGAHVIDEIKSEYAKQDHIATGEARDSWHVVVNSDDGTGMVVSESEGAYYLETGRHPDRKPPPIQEIIKWCKARGISPSKAHSIRLQIARDGIKPTHIIADIAQKYGMEHVT